MRRKDFFETIKNLAVGGTAAMAASPNPLSALEDTFAGKKIERITDFNKLVEKNQKGYDAFNEENGYLRVYGKDTLNWDTITAAFVDRLYSDDRTTSSHEIFTYRDNKNVWKDAGYNTDVRYIPVCGFKGTDSYNGELAPTNNPMDYTIAGKRGKDSRILNYFNEKEIMRYLEERQVPRALPGDLGFGQEINDANGIIEVAFSKTQENEPLVVRAFYKPLKIGPEGIISLEKIIPVEYELRAKKITEGMITPGL